MSLNPTPSSFPAFEASAVADFSPRGSRVLAGGSVTVYADPPDYGHSPLVAELDAVVARKVAGGFSGAVLVAAGNRIILHKGYGQADCDAQRPMTADTLFDIAGLAEQFTATAILMLERQGRLNLGDPLARFFPNAPADKAGLSLHQLATHSAGLASYHGNDFEAFDRDGALRRIFATPLEYSPGCGSHRSGAGYVLLAAVVEQASGQDFRDFLHRRIFRPYDLASTGFFGELRWRNRNTASGYLNGFALGGYDRLAPPSWSTLGTGGLLSSVGDLYRWQRALLSGAVLPRALTQKMFTPWVAESGCGASRGYGYSVVEHPIAGRCLELDGASASTGANGACRLHPNDGLLVVVMSNRWGLCEGATGAESGEYARLFGIEVAERLFHHLVS